MSDSRPSNCLFCSLPAERIADANELAVLIADAYPVADGHTLIIPRRHITDFFELTAEEVVAVYELLGRTRERLAESLKPGGYNVGINVGVVAGQTVPHVHIHLIPRYTGDVADPSGGIRNIIPGRGRYRHEPLR